MRLQLRGAIVLAVLASWTPLHAQTVVLRGSVLEAGSGRPLVGALVRIVGGDRVGVTSDDGTFVMTDLEPGTYLFRAESLGLRPYTFPLSIDGDMSIEVRLEPDPVKLDSLAVTGRSDVLKTVGFFERRSRGLGVFFTRTQIEERNVARFSDLLGSVPGMRLEVDAKGIARARARGINTISGTCNPTYYLDGVPANLQDIGLNVVPVHDIEGVEIYRGSSEIPSQWDAAGGSICGTILVWTRQGQKKPSD